jgi:hypothetical protein
MVVDPMIRSLPMAWTGAHAFLVALSAGIVLVGGGCGRVGYESTGGERGKQISDGGDVDRRIRDAGAGGSAGGGPDGGTAGNGGSPVVMSGGRDSAAGNDAAAGGARAGSADAAPPGPGGDSGSNGDAQVDGAARCTLKPQALSDWCAEIPLLPAPPVIDGELECGLVVRAVVPQAYNLLDPPDSTMDYAIAWSGAGLYFYVRIHDPVVLPAPAELPPWEGDSVELYVDSDGVYGAPPAYDPATRQLIIAAPVSGRTARAETYAVPPTGVAWTSTQFASFPTADGYVVEALVTAADLGVPSWDLVSGNRVGFDLGLNVSGATPDAGTQGTRIGQLFLKAVPERRGFLQPGSDGPLILNVAASGNVVTITAQGRMRSTKMASISA